MVIEEITKTTESNIQDASKTRNEDREEVGEDEACLRIESREITSDSHASRDKSDTQERETG